MGHMELSQRLDFGGVEKHVPNDPRDTFGQLASLIDDTFDLSPAPDTPLADSGLASLDLIELAVRIEERFGVRITEPVYAQCGTVGELAEYIADHEGNAEAKEQK